MSNSSDKASSTPTSDQFEPTRFIIDTITTQTLRNTLKTSSHKDVSALIAEALMVLIAVYDESTQTGCNVTCSVEDGKIQLYVGGGDDGGDGEPIPITEAATTLQLVRRAA